MPTVEDTARAFAARKAGRCHNATTDGTVYRLHGHAIAQWIAPHVLRLDWCGWHTPTTANHLNEILSACGYRGHRLGYSPAHRVAEGKFSVDLAAQLGHGAPMVAVETMQRVTADLIKRSGNYLTEAPV